MEEATKVSDKQIKKEQRKMKREAKYERRYGNPAMAILVKHDPSVRPYYERYKKANREGMVSLVFVAIFVLLGVVDILMILLTQKESWGITYAVDFLIALYWLQDFKISEQKADMLRHEFIQYADSAAVVRATKEMFGKDKDESDKAEKVG